MCVFNLCAVVEIASITSMIRCRAESAPIVMSVPQKSLSMDPTRPTMFRCLCCCASESVTRPETHKPRQLLFEADCHSSAAMLSGEGHWKLLAASNGERAEALLKLLY